MVQAASASKNIWVAASDGDLDRVRVSASSTVLIFILIATAPADHEGVQYLIETEGLSPNVKDSNSYTPMHAAASYAHLELLTYLLSVGGDINLRDDDGDTPLYVVESVDTARWMVEHGADAALTNDEGLTVRPPSFSSLALALPKHHADPTEHRQRTRWKRNIPKSAPTSDPSLAKLKPRRKRT